MALTRKEQLIADLEARGIKVTTDGRVAKADIARAVSEDGLHMTADEYYECLESIKNIFGELDSLKGYLLSLLDKENPEKDKLLNEMVDEVIKQRKLFDGFYKHFNK